MVDTPLTEHRTAQSVWPGLANSPRMTLFGFFVNTSCGTAHPRRWSSWTTLRGSSGNAVGGRRTIRRPASSKLRFRASGSCANVSVIVADNNARETALSFTLHPSLHFRDDSFGYGPRRGDERIRSCPCVNGDILYNCCHALRGPKNEANALARFPPNSACRSMLQVAQ